MLIEFTYELIALNSRNAVVELVDTAIAPELIGKFIVVEFSPGVIPSKVECVELCRWAHRNLGYHGREHELRLQSGTITGGKQQTVLSMIGQKGQAP